MAKNEMQTLIRQIDDQKVRKALMYIIDELDRIKSMPPVTEDTKQIATILNKITRNL